LIYICIPTHDEEQTIGVMLWKIRTVMADFHRDYQILVADDASTDATHEVLEPYTRILPLTVFRNPQRRGYAVSLEMLLREAVRRSTYPKRDVIVTLQADFTDEPAEIPSLVKRIEGGADIVTSNMRPGLDRAPRSVRWTWRLLGFLLRRMKWPEGVSDPISGFRAYRVFTVKKALETRSGALLGGWEGWAANAALLRAVVPFARRVEEALVTVRYDRRTRPTRFRALDASRDVLRFVRRVGRNGQVPAGDTAAAPIDATAVEVRAAESVVERPVGRRGAGSPRGAAGRDRRTGAASSGRGERTAAEGERKRSTGRTRGGRGRKREPREVEAATGAAVDVVGASVETPPAAATEQAAANTPAPDAIAAETPASAAAGAETADGAEKAAGGDTGGGSQVRRSRGRRSGGGRSRRGGGASPAAPDDGEASPGAESVESGDVEAGRAEAAGAVATGDGGAGGDVVGGDTVGAGTGGAEINGAETGSAARAGSRAGGSRRRGRRGGRRGGSGRSASARKADPDAAAAPDVAAESEQSLE